MFDVSNERRQYGNGDVRVLSLRFDRPTPYFEFTESIRYAVRVKAERSVDRIRVGMTIATVDGTPVGTCFSAEIAGLTAGEERELLLELASAHLAPGHYFCAISVGRGDHRSLLIDYDLVMDTLILKLVPRTHSSGSLASWPNANWGSISFPSLRNRIHRGELMTKNVKYLVLGSHTNPRSLEPWWSTLSPWQRPREFNSTCTLMAKSPFIRCF